MKSAYLMLGVSTQATTDEIRAAYQQKLKLLQLQQRAGDELALAARATELNVAQEILLNPEKREAHNQALADVRREQPLTPQRSTMARKPPVIITSESSASPIRSIVALVCFVLLVGAGLNVMRLNHDRAEAAAQAAAQQKAEEAARVEAERSAQQAQNEAQALRSARQEQEYAATLHDRQARNDMERSAMRAQVESTLRQYSDTQRMNAELAEARRVEAEARMAEQRRIAEGRRVAEMDKRMVHELCMRNYGRYNC
jgi:curved DNA-binding protein CbpA